MTEKYESKQVQVRRMAGEIHAALADFNNLTPIVEGQADDWRADGDECSFRVKGIAMTLRMTERVSPTLIKIVATDDSPMGFAFWVQLHPVGPYDTRLRLVLHAEMNVMIKMMIGGKIQGALDKIAETIAKAFNA